MTDNIHRGVFKSVSVSRWDFNLFLFTTRKVNEGKLELLFKFRFKSHLSFHLSTLDLSPCALFYQRYTGSIRFLMHQKCLIKKYCEDTILNSQQPLLVHVFLTRGLLRYSNNLNCMPHVNNLPASSCSYSQNQELLISKPILHLSDIIPILITLIIHISL